MTASSATRQPLNPLDIAMRCVDRTIRNMGYPGFETQMLIWLAGRIDADRLRRAIERLGQRHPVIVSRLASSDSDEIDGAYWRFQPGERAVLTEVDLPTSDRQAVIACAERLISVPHDPTQKPPLHFHLLHRPDGRDVLLMQYNHVLMDNSGTVPLMRQLDQLTQPSADLQAQDEEPSRSEPQHLLNHFLRRVPHEQRHAAALQAIELNGRVLRGRAAILGKGDEDKPRSPQLKVATRVVERDRARALHARIVRLCGLPSMSMGILASVFRSMRQHGPEDRNANRNYIAGIGLDLNLRGGKQSLFQNLLSVVPISARPDELDDRDALVGLLSRQFRERLQSKIDVGVLRLAGTFARRPRHIRWVMEHLLRWSYSLWYAYFGSLDQLGPKFCGVEVEDVFYIGPTWSPLGISLLVNQFRGRLLFQATYDPQLVSEQLAEAFLDTLLADLDVAAIGQ